MGLGTVLSKVVRVMKTKEVVPITQYVDKDKVLKDKAVLITGGDSGIGFSIAEACLKSGAEVVITGTNEEKLKKACEKMGGHQVHYLALNLFEVQSFQGKLNEALSLLSNKRIDILVNSAGRNNMTKFFDTNEEQWDNVIDVNLKGTFFLCQTVSRYMIDKGIRGHILNVSSSSALRPAWSPYQISKWGIDGFTRGLADTLIQYGIVVNAIAPGPTATPMLGFAGDTDKPQSIQNIDNRVGRYIMPSEIAQLAVYMISDCANMVVGDTFYVTGGSGIISLHH